MNNILTKILINNKMNISPELSEKCVNTIRVLSADIVERAKSGHPGAPMGCAPIAHVLFSEFIKFSNKNPLWWNRDRFVLSNGHACALQYSMLHLCGYDLSIDDLKQFRQLGSKTPGHPENGLTPGVEVSTGPLGQGICNAVGMAIAESHLNKLFNKPNFNIIDHYTYVICGDGCLQEGVSSEACSLAGHLQLGKLIVCYDDNKVTIDGDTSLSFTEDVNKRFESYGWHVQTITDVNDINALKNAINIAKSITNKPSLIKIATIIGHGSEKQGTCHVHGAPLGNNDLQHVKKLFGFNPNDSFIIPEDVRNIYQNITFNNNENVNTWEKLLNEYNKQYPELANELNRRFHNELYTNDWQLKFPKYSHLDTKQVATRSRSEEILNVLANIYPEVIGGSADLTPSNLTLLKGSFDYTPHTPDGRYIRFGVREHGMAAICNGIYAHGGIRPYCATFLNFIGYALGSFRLSCLSSFGIMYVMTHDSIGLGEDGPTHQPVEMLATLRSHPNCHVIRPADGNETVGAYIEAMKYKNTPTVLVFSRQGVPTLENSNAENVSKGGYIIKEFGNMNNIDLIIVSTGTEVSLSIDTAKELFEKSSLSIRVISMPCCELFDKQSLEYRLSLFPDNIPVMSIEASSIYGWNKYAHYVVGMSSFGMSAPGNKVYEAFGFTVPQLVNRGKEAISQYKALTNGCNNNMPSLMRLLQHHSIIPAHAPGNH